MANEVKTSGLDTASRSDYQKSSDRPGMGVGANSGLNTRRDFSDTSSDTADDVESKAKETGEKIKEKASDIGHSMQDAGHNISEKSKHSHEAICKFTKENPTAAVLMAFGLGAILARILPKW